ncbi:MAG: aspartate 1-decarboxylase [Actinomycetota bacterium]|nr:aspartate 1-decarboxylase [Actinomycetota bacterium]
MESRTYRFLLKSKIHRATVTAAEIEYIGSITIDKDLMQLGDILPYEQVHVWDMTNGNRLTTYAIEGEAGSGQVCMNGAAARLVGEGDKVIIASFVSIPSEKALAFRPRIVFVDEKNKPVKVDDFFAFQDNC